MQRVVVTLGPATGVETETFSGTELDAWRGFLRTQATLLRELDEELTRRHGLPLSSYDVLVQLADAEGGRLRMSQLADAVLLSRSGLTRLITRLVEQGLIERDECENDARGSFAVITTKGLERFSEASRTHRAGVRERFFDRLGQRDMQQLARIWGKLLD